MAELSIIFPPQWSPFQPPLSLPALAAWLRRAGFEVSVTDGNILFYDWLLSEDCEHLLLESLYETSTSDGERLGISVLIRARDDIRSALDRLRSQNSARKESARCDDENLREHHDAVRLLETYLSAVSKCSSDFEITPYGFQIKQSCFENLDAMQLLARSPRLLRRYAELIVDQLIAADDDVVGFSCIGQEQLYFTLLIGALFKQRSKRPVIVGGTIFERGSLPVKWFGEFFDIVVKNEGEAPCQAMLINLRAGRSIDENVSGIVFMKEGMIHNAAPCSPLTPREVPIPDFDGLPLHRYLSPAVTLPILASRGCYWGKCEFCHHGMVYGEKYSAYEINQLLKCVNDLSEKYGVNHFSFNDEALPPKLARQIGLVFPQSSESGWYFTALFKFEKYYEALDFKNLYKIGMRSLYVGMESASERVLSAMKKPNSIDIIRRNLTDATSAGIWTHSFLFFGFPTETTSEAEETYNFVFSNQEIFGSVGCGTFSLEHNAPIFKHLADFDLSIDEVEHGHSVYYTYQAKNGLSARSASDWMQKFNKSLYDVPKFRAVAWIPREHLLYLLSVLTPIQLIDEAGSFIDGACSKGNATVSDLFAMLQPNDGQGTVVAVNRLTSRVMRLKRAAAASFIEMHSSGTTLDAFEAAYPGFYQAMIPALDSNVARSQSSDAVSAQSAA